MYIHVRLNAAGARKNRRKQVLVELKPGKTPRQAYNSGMGRCSANRKGLEENNSCVESRAYEAGNEARS